MAVPTVTDPTHHSVALLAQEWSVLSDLLHQLSTPQWSLPALPGWSVHDVVAHLVGTERMLAGDPVPEIDQAATPGAHIHNDIGWTNEAWVLALRGTEPAPMVAAFDAITSRRLSALRAMGPADFDAPSWTPVGQATYGRFMEVRVFDTWMHEQDIRAAVGRPGHEDGPVAEQALQEVVTALGYIVGKRVGAPAGTSVTIDLDGPLQRALNVEVTDRARVVATFDGPPTTSVRLSSTLFLRLAGGRVDPKAVMDQVTLHGDVELGRRVASHLAYTI